MLLRLARRASLCCLVVVLAACNGSGTHDAGPGSGDAGKSAVHSRVHLDISPPIVQPGSGVAPAGQADVVLAVRVAGAKRGRAVAIQRRVGDGDWQDVARLRVDADGEASRAEPTHDARGRIYAYRAVVGHGGPTNTSPARTSRHWQLKFGDEFDGSTLDSGRWAYRQEGVYAPASDRACSASSPDAVDVERGRLVLKAVEDRQRNAIGPCDEEDGNTRADQSWYRNGHIGARTFHFRYGYAAARMKFDSRQGAHGSFWLQSAPVPTREPGAEIDVVESFGAAFAKWHKPDSVYSFIYYLDEHGKQVKVPGDDDPEQAVTRTEANLRPDETWSSGYHVFSVLWTPHLYVFYVDGVPTQSVDRGVSHVAELPILSVLTSGWEVHRFPSGAKLHTDVDWVRVWQRPGATCSGTPAC